MGELNTEGDEKTRRRARPGRRRAHQRPGVPGRHAPARPLHAVPGRGSDGQLLRHARRDREPGCGRRRACCCGSRPAPDQTVPYVPDGAGRRATHDRRPAALRPGVGERVDRRSKSDAEIVVDRTMRWDQSSRGGAHAESSVPAPALRWYLAEGATHGFFDLFYLIQNPSLTTAAQTCRSGSCARRARRIERDVYGRGRQPLHAAGRHDPGARGDGRVGGDREHEQRADHRGARDVLVGGGDVRGGPRQRRRDGAVDRVVLRGRGDGRFFDYFLLFANPNATPAQVRDDATCCRAGRRWSKTYTVPANSRRTIYVAAEDRGAARTRRCRRRSASPMPASACPDHRGAVDVVAERAAVVRGAQLGRVDDDRDEVGVGDGEVRRCRRTATQTYLLVANTSAFAATAARDGAVRERARR